MYQEDDITASVVVPADKLKNVFFREERKSLKFSQNCEFRLFQRPDDAIYRGYDKMVSRIYICTHIHTHTHTHTHFVCVCVCGRARLRQDGQQTFCKVSTLECNFIYALG
jgi:hypothetical protein